MILNYVNLAKCNLTGANGMDMINYCIELLVNKKVLFILFIFISYLLVQTPKYS